ncbi:MAG: hypothetical protein VKJ04_09595 [Vampirovibrionales bacterium]|nr:hypothetical protein [Vampirovibrionales bacterium]
MSGSSSGSSGPKDGGAFAGGIHHQTFSKEQSPLGLAEEVAQLMKMPQSLCKQRGCCCRVATFKGSLSYDEIKAMANDPNEPDADNARDFVTLFIPYENQQAVRQIAPEFVDRVREAADKKGSDPDKVSFFHCRFVGEDNRCGVHEDRPSGCRAYPIPHAKTIFHPGCGFEEQSRQNWARIAAILDQLGLDETGRPKASG